MFTSLRDSFYGPLFSQPFYRNVISRFVETTLEISTLDTGNFVLISGLAFWLRESEKDRVFTIDAIPEIKNILELFVKASNISTTGGTRTVLAPMGGNPQGPIIMESDSKAGGKIQRC